MDGEIQMKLLLIVLLITSCAAPPKRDGMKQEPCPKREIYYYNTSVANVEIYNQIQTTHKF